MIRVGICFEDVAEAAETLQANGENPTIDRVRTFLGGTGSNTTISKYLNMWRSQPSSQRQIDTSLSSHDPVQNIVKRVWQQLREDTNAEIEEIKLVAQTLVMESEEKAVRAIKECEQVQVTSQGYKEQIYALQAKTEIQLLDFKKLQEEYALLQERYKGLDARFMDLQRITLKHQDDMAQAHKNEIHYVVEKSKEQESAYQKLVYELKIYNEDQRIRHANEIATQKNLNQQLESALSILKKTTIAKELELVEVKTQLTAISKERDGLSARVTEQEKYWKLFETNSQITSNIWTEVKEIPKFDFSLSSLSCFNDFYINVNNSMGKLEQVTDDVKNTVELFKNLNVIITK